MGALKVGSQTPAFSALDYEGMEINNEDLLGTPYVLYFYPKDDTPGCTKEACSFRDTLETFDDLNIPILGVSPDSAESHSKFAEKYNLDFPLICDEKLELAKKFGATEEKEIDGQKKLAIVRTTYLIDSEGKIRWIEQPVAVDGHIERILEAIEQEELSV